MKQSVKSSLETEYKQVKKYYQIQMKEINVTI